MRQSKTEKRTLGAIGTARLAVPDYARGNGIRGGQVERLTAVFNLRIHRATSELPAVLTPPIAGKYRLYLGSTLTRQAERFVVLHELGHVLAGDADEPTVLQFNGPLPQAEEVADLFALTGLVRREDCVEGTEWLQERIRELAPIDDPGWQVHRIARLAPRLIRIRRLLDQERR